MILPAADAPTLAAREKAKVLLSRALGPSKLLTEADACERYSTDDSGVAGETPCAVVLAEKAEDILAALAAAKEACVPITPRAAGTGRTGGATALHGGIVLSLLGMNRIRDIDRRERIA